MPFTYRYPRPALTVDCVVLGLGDSSLEVLLVRRGAPPFEGRWALPGGFLELDERLERAARRELAEETGITVSHLEQIEVFDDPKRDPRERVISVGHLALVSRLEAPRAGDDAKQARWFGIDELPRLAFDHARILAAGREHLRRGVRYGMLAFELLPRKFTLGQLQRVYELSLGTELDKRNFRKKILASGVLEALEEVEQDVAHRAARFYRVRRPSSSRPAPEGGWFELGLM